MINLRIMMCSIILQLGFVPMLWAVSDLSTSLSNPSSVSATLAVSCESAVSTFEKKFDQFFVGVPYVRQVSKVSGTAFRDGEKSTTHHIQNKEIYYSLDTTMAKEFPMSLATVTLEKKICLKKDDPKSECKDKWNLTLDGAKTVTYQKAVALGKSQNIWKSFSMSFTFTPTGSNSCSYSSTLTVNDSQYVWAKKHLLGQMEPVQLEKYIHKSVTDWSSRLAAKLEGEL